MSKHVTVEMWEKCERFDDLVEPGDSVDEAIVDNFRDILPPAMMLPGFLQVGEACDHVKDESGRYRATYATFAKDQTGKWIFYGECFAGTTKNQKGKGDPWA